VINSTFTHSLCRRKLSGWLFTRVFAFPGHN